MIRDVAGVLYRPVLKTFSQAIDVLFNRDNFHTKVFLETTFLKRTQIREWVWIYNPLIPQV